MFFLRWFREEKQRAMVRAAYTKYLSPKLAEALAAPPKALDLTLVPADVSFILFHLRDDPPELVQRHVEKAFPIVLAYEGFIVESLSSFTIVMFQGFPWQKALPDRRADAVASLMATLGTDIRLVHGRAACLIGNIGVDTRFSYGAVFPSLARRVETLLGLEFGQAMEVTPATP
jgi:hypothetical protein